MRKIWYILCMLFIFFSCAKNKKEVQPELKNQRVDSVTQEPTPDKDSLFCDKIMTYILEESKNWPVDYTFERQDWKVADGKKAVDFNFIDGLVREVHYFAKDKESPFSKVEVNYYIFEDASIARAILRDYREMADSAVENWEVRGRVIGLGFIKTPNLLYRQGATVFHIVSDNGVKHIVYGALAKFEQEGGIDESGKTSFY